MITLPLLIYKYRIFILLIMFKIVFFDGNGVIYDRDNNYESGFFNKIEQETGFKNVETVFDMIKYDCMKNEFSRVELFKIFVKIVGSEKSPEILDKEYAELKANNIFLLKDCVPVLKFLKNNNIKIGLLSDGIFKSGEKRVWLKKMGVAKYFDYLFCSRDLGFTKIYPQNIKKVLKEVGVEKNEVLLVAHEMSDFLGALHEGVPTLCINKSVSTDYNVDGVSEVPDFLVKEELL